METWLGIAGVVAVIAGCLQGGGIVLKRMPWWYEWLTAGIFFWSLSMFAVLGLEFAFGHSDWPIRQSLPTLALMVVGWMVLMGWLVVLRVRLEQTKPDRELEKIRQDGCLIHDDLTAPNGWTAFLSVKGSQPTFSRVEKWRKRAAKHVPPRHMKAWEGIWDAILASPIRGTQPEDQAARQRAELEWRLDRALRFISAIQHGTDPESGVARGQATAAPPTEKVISGLFVDLRDRAAGLAQDAALSLPADNPFWPDFDSRYGSFRNEFGQQIRTHRQTFIPKAEWALGDVHLAQGDDRLARGGALRSIQRIQKVLDAVVEGRDASSVDTTNPVTRVFARHEQDRLIRAVETLTRPRAHVITAYRNGAGEAPGITPAFRLSAAAIKGYRGRPCLAYLNVENKTSVQAKNARGRLIAIESMAFAPKPPQLDIPLAWAQPDDPHDPARKSFYGSAPARLYVARRGAPVAARPPDPIDPSGPTFLKDADLRVGVEVSADNLPPTVGWFRLRWWDSIHLGVRDGVTIDRLLDYDDIEVEDLPAQPTPSPPSDPNTEAAPRQ